MISWQAASMPARISLPNRPHSKFARAAAIFTMASPRISSLDSRDVEVLERAGRLDAVVSGRGDRFLSQ
jgi:hypothetical protein